MGAGAFGCAFGIQPGLPLRRRTAAACSAPLTEWDSERDLQIAPDARAAHDRGGLALVGAHAGVLQALREHEERRVVRRRVDAVDEEGEVVVGVHDGVAARGRRDGSGEDLDVGLLILPMVSNSGRVEAGMIPLAMPWR